MVFVFLNLEKIDLSLKYLQHIKVQLSVKHFKPKQFSFLKIYRCILSININRTMTLATN